MRFVKSLTKKISVNLTKISLKLANKKQTPLEVHVNITNKKSSSTHVNTNIHLSKEKSARTRNFQNSRESVLNSREREREREKKTLNFNINYE
jgi:hypothetical protein